MRRKYKKKENKIYNVTIFDIFTNLSISIMILAVFVVLPIWSISEIEFSWNHFWLITFIFSLAILILSLYGIFPVYLCWTYYQKEKNVTVVIDYEKEELQYIEQGKETQYIKFEDIDIIEIHRRYRMVLGYEQIILNNGNSIVITSLLMSSIDVPKRRSKIEYSRRLLLPEEEEYS